MEVLVAISYSLGVSLDDLIYADSRVENFGIVKRTITKMIDECTASEQGTGSDLSHVTKLC